MAHVAELLWSQASLRSNALKSLQIGPECPCQSTFHVNHFATGTIACAALAAAQLLAYRRGTPEDVPKVSIDPQDALAEFMCEKMATLDGEDVKIWDSLVGIYKAKDGWLRPHTNWAHHREGLLDMLGLPRDTRKADLAKHMLNLSAIDTAERAMDQGLVMTALRSFSEWDDTEQGITAMGRGGMRIEPLRNRMPKALPALTSSRPLEGIKVLDLTRVIAGPTAGRTLATYGAEVLWITAPHLPSLPPLDADTSRGKRTAQLDLRQSSQEDRKAFEKLVSEADVLLQSYRPGALEDLGYSIDRLLELNPDLIYATLSAYGEVGPWSQRKGFDSLVQFAVGINEAEGRTLADRNGVEFSPRALPCQALDHGAGYLLAFGIERALLLRAQEGGAYKVEVSLLSTATFLRSLGRTPQFTLFASPPSREDLRQRGRLDTIEQGWQGKRMEFVRHAAEIEGAEIGSSRTPRGYNDCQPTW